MSTSQNYNAIVGGKVASDLGFTFDIPQYTDVTSYTSELRYSGQIGTQTNKAIGCLRMTYTIIGTKVVPLQGKEAGSVVKASLFNILINSSQRAE